MKRLAMTSAFCLLLAATPIHAEKPVAIGRQLDTAISPGDLKTTPEMWFYEQQMRQYNDPKAMVRANAEAHAQARMRRIESMRWFGLSNSRPRASSDPFNNDYSPGWVSTPGYHPWRWNGVGQP